MSQNKRQSKNIIILALVNVFWGLTAVLLKHVLVFMSPSAYVFLRFLVSALVLLVATHHKIFRAKRRTVGKAALLGLMGAVVMLLMVGGLEMTSSSNSVFISQLSIVFVPAISCLASRTLPSKSLTFTVVWMLAGVIVFIGGFEMTFNGGDALSFAAMLLDSFMIYLTFRLLCGEDAITLGVLRLLFSAMFSAVFWFIFGAEPFVINFYSGGILLLTGVIGTAVCFVLQVSAQKDTDPFLVSLMSLVNTIFGALGALMIPDLQGNTEHFGIRKWAGCIIMIGGMIFYLVRNRRATAA